MSSCFSYAARIYDVHEVWTNPIQGPHYEVVGLLQFFMVLIFVVWVVLLLVVLPAYGLRYVSVKVTCIGLQMMYVLRPLPPRYVLYATTLCTYHGYSGVFQNSRVACTGYSKIWGQPTLPLCISMGQQKSGRLG